MLRKCSFFTLLFLFTCGGGVPSFKELVGSRCVTLEIAAVESLQDACLGEREYTYMNVSVHLQLGCGLELRAFGGVAGSVGKYSQKACTLVFPTSLHLQKKKKNAGQKSLILNVKYGFILSCHSV